MSVFLVKRVAWMRSQTIGKLLYWHFQAQPGTSCWSLWFFHTLSFFLQTLLWTVRVQKSFRAQLGHVVLIKTFVFAGAALTKEVKFIWPSVIVNVSSEKLVPVKQCVQTRTSNSAVAASWRMAIATSVEGMPATTSSGFHTSFCGPCGWPALWHMVRANGWRSA